MILVKDMTLGFHIDHTVGIFFSRLENDDIGNRAKEMSVAAKIPW